MSRNRFRCAVLVLALVPLATIDAQRQQINVPRSSLPVELRNVLDRDGLRAMRAGGVLDTISRGTNVLSVGGGDLIVGATGNAAFRLDSTESARFLESWGATAPAQATVTQLPLIVGVADPLANGITTLKPYVLASAMRYDAANGVFIADIRIGLEVVGAGAMTRRPLDPSIGLSLLADADSVVPSRLEIKESGGAPIPVIVYSRAATDSVVLTISLDADPSARVQSTVRVAGSLAFIAPPKKVQGFGVEARKVRVGIVGRQLTEPLIVTVTTSSAADADTVVLLQPGHTAAVIVKADELGPLTLVAHASGYPRAETTIEATAPIRFLGAALIGLLVAACGAWIGADEAKRRGRIGASVLFSLVALVAYMGLGINLTDYAVSTPLNSTLAVLAFTAIGGSAATITRLVRNRVKPNG